MKATVFCVFAAFLLLWPDEAHCNPEKPKKIDVSVKLSVINVKESAIPPVELRVAEGTTAFSILQLASQQSPCYKFEHQYYPDLGRFITSICCMEQNQIAKLYWMIYINGQLATVGVDNLKPKNGDRITFKYERVGQTEVRNHRDESEL